MGTAVVLVVMDLIAYFGGSYLPPVRYFWTASRVGREHIHNAQTGGVIQAIRDTHITHAFCGIIDIIFTSNVVSHKIII